MLLRDLNQVVVKGYDGFNETRFTDVILVCKRTLYLVYGALTSAVIRSSCLSVSWMSAREESGFHMTLVRSALVDTAMLVFRIFND